MNARSRDQSKPRVVSRVRNNRRHGDEDVSRCSLPWREASHRQRGGCYHEGTPTPQRLTLFSLRYHHEGDSQPLVVDLEAASKPSQTFRGTNHKLIPHRSTPTAQESPTSKSNKIKGEMLKTCSNHELLWSQEGEGEDLSVDWNNSQEHSLISPGSKIWCRRSEREPLVFLG